MADATGRARNSAQRLSVVQHPSVLSLGSLPAAGERKAAPASLNMRGAFLEVATDTATSVRRSRCRRAHIGADLSNTSAVRSDSATPPKDRMGLDAVCSW